MERLPFQEPVDVWCPFCGSRGTPAGEGYCEECRPLRVRFLRELPARSLGFRIRRAVHRVFGVDPGRGILGAVTLGALLALALLFVVLGA